MAFSLAAKLSQAKQLLIDVDHVKNGPCLKALGALISLYRSCAKGKQCRKSWCLEILICRLVESTPAKINLSPFRLTRSAQEYRF
jgi:hypothetical protein